MALYLGKNLINGVLTTHYTTILDTTDANAKDLEIFAGKTAYVNGQKVTGTFAPDPSQIKANEVVANVTGTFTNDGTATSGEHIRSGYIAYSKGIKITGTYEGLDTTLSNGATASQILSGYSAYANGLKIDGTMQSVSHNAPTVTINSSTGVVSASHTQSTGYVTGGTKTGTLTLSTQATATITPGTTAKTAVAKGKYTLGDVTVKGDANLIAANIKSGVSIFGITGNAPSNYYTTGSASASSYVYSMSCSFVPKGIIMYRTGLTFDSDKNIYLIIATSLSSGAGSGTVCYTTETTSTETVDFTPISPDISDMYNLVSDETFYDDEGSVDLGDTFLADYPISEFDAALPAAHMTNYGFNSTDTADALFNNFSFQSFQDGYEDTVEVTVGVASRGTTTATVTYSSGTLKVTVPDTCYCYGLDYVIWG